MRTIGPWSDKPVDFYITLHKKEQRRYVHIYTTDPRTLMKTTSYARFLMEQHTGRLLFEYETVDHVDGDKLNDQIENLQILSHTDNVQKFFGTIGEPLVSVYVCPICNSSFERETCVVERDQVRKGYAGPFCSKSCRSKYARSKERGAQIGSMGK